jgi:hypothetical protein
LSTKNTQTTRPSKKLDHKRLGPFQIIQKVGSHAHKLKLPPSMKIRPVFYVYLLNPETIKNLQDIYGRVVPPSPPIFIDGQAEFVVKEIVDSRYYRNQLQCKIKWQGYPDPSEDTWKSIEDLENAPDAIKDFHFTLPKQALICFSSSYNDPNGGGLS